MDKTQAIRAWADVKVSLQNSNRNPFFREREIWWCSVGVNLGHEQDGKGQYYERPVLIVTKFSQNSFWGIPATSTIKDHPLFFKCIINDRQGSFVLSQMRFFDNVRLRYKIGILSESDFSVIKVTLKNLV